jgi:hypothetical protein
VIDKSWLPLSSCLIMPYVRIARTHPTARPSFKVAQPAATRYIKL